MFRRRTLLGGASLAALGWAAVVVDSESDDDSNPVPEPEVRSDGIHRQGSWHGLEQAAVEQAIHERVNDERETSLEYDTELGRIARFHSWQMATEGFYDHESPDGEGVQDRYDRFGSPCQGGENINKMWAFTETKTHDGETTTYSDAEELAAGTVTEWMHSEGHRENLLNSRWSAEGIGAWWIPDEEYGGVRVYLTQNFC